MSQGSVVDVVVDVRAHSGFGTVAHFDLAGDRGDALWVPVGFAHGFQALEDDTIVNWRRRSKTGQFRGLKCEQF